MNVRDQIDVVSTVVVAIAAIAMVVMAAGNRSSKPRPLADAQSVEDWAALVESGTMMGGNDDADMVVVAFLDFACPYCRTVASVLDTLLVEHPEDVSFVFHHFPLNGHIWALPSAIAAECAARQGRFPEMVKALFASSAVLGQRPWAALAGEAGVADLSAFEECAGHPVDSFPGIATGRTLGEELGVTGTPTLWVNGRRFNGRSVESFEEAASDLGIVFEPL